jgi:hypothetical protein
LYLGTEVGIFASFDAGEHWVRFGLKNLPNVAVRDIFIQREQNDILIATHGRGLWVLDDAAVVQDAAGARAAHLFPVRPALRHSVRATRAGGGDTEFAASNPPYGALLTYYLPTAVDDIRFEVSDANGKAVRAIAGPRIAHDAGLHRIAWDLRGTGPGARGPQVLPGEYTVKMRAGTSVAEQKVRVELDPELKIEPDELKAQWDSLGRISEMISGAGGMVREADKKSDSPQWRQLRERLARPQDLSAGETGPRLAEQLQSLYNLIEGPNRAPTPAMVKLLGELENEYRTVENDFQKLRQ